MPKLGLDRKILASLLQNNHQAIVAFENIFNDVDVVVPRSLIEIATLAATAAAVANQALAMLAELSGPIERLEFKPAAPDFPEPDFTPTSYYGTMSQQNADAVDITGGTISGVTITGDITGNAATATALQTARTINGVSFNGTANIVITDATRALLAGSSSQAFATAALTATTANLLRTVLISGASGGLGIYGYYDATNGVIMEARNTALTAYLPINIQGISVSFYAPNGMFTTNKFGYNGKLGEALVAAPAAAIDLPTSITAINNIIARLTALGTYT